MRNLFLHISIILAILLVGISGIGYAQKSSYLAEKKQQADKYFAASDFVKAMPLYSQLLSNNPADAELNYKFGVCLVYADKSAGNKAIEHLKKVRENKSIPIERFYYLGLAYHQNYQFNEAINEYMEFKKQVKPAVQKKYGIDRSIETAKNGITLMNNIRDLYVLEKKELREADYFRSYNSIPGLGGKFLVLPDEFTSSLDKKKGARNILFLADTMKEVYFSSYGNSGSTGKDIYRCYKLIDGKWSKPQNLGSPVNTEYDEDFPYLMPDGKTLYFCSKGNNSMGNYDIFKSVYDYDRLQWSEPVNLDFAINSPHNDMLFVPDSLERYAYFSSDRENIGGMITFYKVRIDKRPPSKLQTVQNVYSLDYKNRTPVYEEKIEQIRTLASLQINSNEEMFEEEEQKPQQNTNTLASTSESKSSSESEQDIIPLKNLTNKEIANIATQNAEQSQKEAKETRMKADNAYAFAKMKEVQYMEKKEEAAILERSAADVTDVNEKQQIFNQANEIKAEAFRLKTEMDIAFEIANQLEKQAKIKQEDAIQANIYATKINKAINSKSTDSTIALLTEMNKQLEASKSQETKPADLIASNDQKAYQQKKAEADKYFSQYEDLKKDAEEIKKEIESHKNKASISKSEVIKAEHLKNASNSEDDLAEKQKEMDMVLKKGNLAKKQADSIIARTQMVADLIQEIDKTPVTPVLADNKNATKSTSTKNTSKTVNETKSNTTTVNSNTTAPLAENSSKPSTTPETKGTTNTKPAESTKAKDTKSIEPSAASLNKQILDEAKAVVNDIKQIYTKADENARLKYNYALERDRLSQVEQTKAENILIALQNKPNDAELIQAFNQHRNKAIEYARESIIAYKMAKAQDSIASIAQDMYADAILQQTLIEQFVKNNHREEASEKLNSIKQLYQSKSNELTAEPSIKTSSESIEVLEKGKTELSENISKQENEAKQLQSAALDLRNQAKQTKKKSKRDELYDKANDLENKADVINEDIKDLKRDLAKITDRIDSYKNTQLVYNEIKENISTYQPTSQDNKTSDKNALATNIKNYEQLDVFSPNTKYIASNYVKKEETYSTTSTTVEATPKSLPEQKLPIIDVVKAKEKEQLKIAMIKASNNEIEREIALLQTELNQKPSATLKNNLEILQLSLKNNNELISRSEANIAAIEQSKTSDNEVIYKPNEQPVSYLEIKDKQELVTAMLYTASTHSNKAKELRSEALQSKKKKQVDLKIKQAKKEDDIAMYITLEAFEIIAYINQSKYYENKNIINSLRIKDDNNAEILKANNLETEADELFYKARLLRLQARSAEDYETMKKMLQEADNLEKLAIEKLKAAQEIYRNYKPTQPLAINSGKEADKQLTNEQNKSNTSVADAKSTNKTVNATNNQPQKQAENNNTNIAEAKNSTENTNNNVKKPIKDNTTANVDAKNIAITNNTSTNFPNQVVNKNEVKQPISSTPIIQTSIPIGEKIPDGLIYKIQVGAYRIPKNIEFFNGLAPISAEIVYEDVVAYLAGVFYSRSDAIIARNLIRSIGYKEAFIVAYYNGKRISYKESIQIEASTGTSNKTAQLYIPNVSFSPSSTSSTKTATANTSNFTSPDIINTKGVVFRIQIGAYKNPVSNEVYAAYKDLATEMSPSGYIRYMTGKFTIYSDANNEKNRIVANGISDAFVVAYSDGVRIGIKQALEKISQ